MAEKLGVKATFQETQFDGIFAGLDAKRFDTIANQISINAERKAKYDFSTPYTVSTGVIVTKADNNSITCFDSLKGKTTAQSLTSNLYKLAVDSRRQRPGRGGLGPGRDAGPAGTGGRHRQRQAHLPGLPEDQPDAGLKIAAETTDKSKAPSRSARAPRRSPPRWTRH